MYMFMSISQVHKWNDTPDGVQSSRVCVNFIIDMSSMRHTAGRVLTTYKHWRPAVPHVKREYPYIQRILVHQQYVHTPKLPRFPGSHTLQEESTGDQELGRRRRRIT